jgi:large subunit ribosomal protein L31e
MAEKEKKKIENVLERIYVIPLRHAWLKVPKYKRAKKCIRTIKLFLARHMKLYDGDLSKIKLDMWLNRAIWVRGIKNVPHKIKVKAVKDSEGIVKVELISLPKSFRVEDSLLKKKIEKSRKKAEQEKEKQKKKEKTEEKKEEDGRIEEEKIKEKEEKEKEKILHKEIKHEHKHIHEVKGQVKTEVHKTNTKK